MRHLRLRTQALRRCWSRLRHRYWWLRALLTEPQVHLMLLSLRARAAPARQVTPAPLPLPEQARLRATKVQPMVPQPLAVQR